MMWVYVKGIYHLQQNSDAQKPWTAIQDGAKPVFAEVIEKPMVWQDGYFMSQALGSRIERFDSLTDRDYRVTRSGVRNSQQVRRELEHMEPSPLSDELIVLANTLPDLGLIATGAIDKMDGSGPGTNTSTTVETGSHSEVAMPSQESSGAGNDLPF